MTLVFSLVFFNSCFAKSFDEFDSHAKQLLQSSKIIEYKVYVAPETVYISSDQILLNFNGAILPVRNISVDQEGIYAPLEEVLAAIRDDNFWECTRCGFINSEPFNRCSRCNKSRYSR